MLREFTKAVHYASFFLVPFYMLLYPSVTMFALGFATMPMALLSLSAIVKKSDNANSVNEPDAFE